MIDSDPSVTEDGELPEITRTRRRRSTPRWSACRSPATPSPNCARVTMNRNCRARATTPCPERHSARWQHTHSLLPSGSRK